MERGLVDIPQDHSIQYNTRSSGKHSVNISQLVEFSTLNHCVVQTTNVIQKKLIQWFSK